MGFFIRLLRSSVLAVWGIFFAWLLIGGRDHLIRLLNPDLWWLIVCGAVLLLLLALFTFLRLNQKSQPFATTFFQVAILLLPLLYFPLTLEGRFSGMTLEKRGIIPVIPEMTEISPPLVEDQLNRLDEGEISLMNLIKNTDKYQGKSIEISGMVFHHDKLPENVFMCYRFLMTCCAADARPIFAMVNYENAEELPLDIWVRVRGTFSMVEKEGVPIPSIQAEKVEQIEEPAIPFLF